VNRPTGGLEERMPKVSEFFGIAIYMYYDDRPEPHFHATYCGREVKVRIADLSVLAGGLNARAMGLVVEWATQHRTALRDNLGLPAEHLRSPDRRQH
jgi:hypothetical protein